MSKLTRSFQASSCRLESACESLHALQQSHKEGKFIAAESIASLSQEISDLESLPLNRALHSLSISDGFGALAYLGDPIIRVFASCGSLLEACLVVCKVSDPTVYTWQAIITAHLQQEKNALALFFYSHMQHLGTHPNKFIFTSGLKACTALGNILQGNGIHIHIVKSGFEADHYIESTLVDMHMKCSNFDEAQKIFDLSKARDNVLWTTMISGYAQAGCGAIALQFFHDMQRHGQKPNDYAFSCALKACSTVADIHEGTLLHIQIVMFGLDSDTVISNALICMYTACKYLTDARHVFDGLHEKTISSWGAMLAGYAQHGYGLCALCLLRSMQHIPLKPNRAIYLYSLKACSSISALIEGMLIHDQVLKSSLDSEAAIGSGLVDVYARCGCLSEGHKVHNSLLTRSMVAWGAIIYGYLQHGHCFSALELLRTYQHEGFLPDKVLYLCSIKVNVSIGDVRLVKMLHAQVLSDEVFSADEVIANALLDAYGKCGHMDDACRLFEQCPRESLISCSSMIGGYAQHGQSLMALGLYHELQTKSKRIDSVIFLSAMKACSNVGLLGQAMEIHDHIIRSGIGVDTRIGNTLVALYGKCGVLLEAENVLERLPMKDGYSWGAMLAGHASLGHTGHMKQCLTDMHQQGVKPNGAVYCSLLSACSRVGAVAEGLQFFNAMKLEHGVEPNIKHFTGIIDLLCRSGLLNEAEHLLFVAHSLLDLTGWTSLLSACKSYGTINLGSHSIEHVSEVCHSSFSKTHNMKIQHELPAVVDGLVFPTGFSKNVINFTKEICCDKVLGKPILPTCAISKGSFNHSCYSSFTNQMAICKKTLFTFFSCIFCGCVFYCVCVWVHGYIALSIIFVLVKFFLSNAFLLC